MISDAEIARAKAVPIAHLVASFLPLKRDFALCVWHNERTPSMHVDRKRNIVFCFGCGKSADTIAFLRAIKRLDFCSAVEELCGGRQPGGTWTRPATPVSPERASRWQSETPSFVLELWRTATAPRLASWYLESRGIAQKPLPQALRGHQRVPCTESGCPRPAMLAALTDDGGRVMAIQRTWIEPRLEYDGHTEHPKGARASLEAPKKTLGPMGNGAVRLAAAGDVLGIAESVEDALAAARLFGLPVWASCGAARMGNIALPDQVRHVVMFADADDAGREAAAKAESNYRRRGLSAQCEFPSGGAKDFAEMLR